LAFAYVPAPARGGVFRTHVRRLREHRVVRIITVPGIPGALGWWSPALGSAVQLGCAGT
jgi:hypothetical protein